MKFKTKTAHLSTNQIKSLEESDNIVKFSRPLIITDTSEQYNGTRYDIPSMKIDNYRGLLTIDHTSSITGVVGKVIGLNKGRSKITIDGIDFAVKENATAQFAKDMMLGGYVTDFSIETIGPWPKDENGVWENSELVGLSMVIAGNNKSATLNKAVMNSINKAKENGLDTAELEKQYLPVDKKTSLVNNDLSMKFVTIKNSRDFSIEVSFKNAAGEDSKIVLNAGQSFDVLAEQKDEVEKQINDAVAPVAEVKEEKKETQDLATAINAAVAPLLKEVTDLRKEMLDNSASEPSFTKMVNTQDGKLEGMNYKQRHGKQIESAWAAMKDNNLEASKVLNDINKYNFEALLKAEVIDNSITISDMGNFVISPELLKDIEGVRSNFQPLISKLDFKETLSLQMAWLSRSGDISMSELAAMCDDDADGNLKPISEYGATINTSNLKELAAVTPVCDAATRFLAVDLLGDVAAGYRTDFDRKRAQLFIARLQQAVNETGNVVPYTKTSDVTALKSWVKLMAGMQEQVQNGYYIFNQKTYAEQLSTQIGAGINTDTGFGLFKTGETGMTFLGQPFIVVPNELMPSLNTQETKSFTVDGVSVTITAGVFYVDLSTFTGRTSGGLKYDLSTDASYEVGGEVKSAFQRNELVLRGSFFRGGAIKDNSKVVAMVAAGVS